MFGFLLEAGIVLAAAAAGVCQLLTVARLDPLAPISGSGLNNDASEWTGRTFSTSLMWCPTGPMGDKCDTRSPS